jgi:hypothetical protein
MAEFQRPNTFHFLRWGMLPPRSARSAENRNGPVFSQLWWTHSIIRGGSRHGVFSGRIVILSAADGTSARPPTQEVNTMSIAERPSPAKSSFKIPAPSENVLLVIVACAFLGFHVLVGMMVHSALPNEPVQQLEHKLAWYGD